MTPATMQQDIGRLSGTIVGDQSLNELYSWGPKLLSALQTLPRLRDVNSDQQMNGLEENVVIDRDTARARLGITPQQIDDALYDAFGQREISTIYRRLNQYHVVLEVDPRFKNEPDSLKAVYVIAQGKEVPLSSFVHFGVSNTALAVNHQGQFPSVTISFNLAPGFKDDTLNDILPIPSYATTVRRKLIDIAAKVVRTGREVILKITQAVMKCLHLQTLWVRCQKVSPIPT